jgi:hypothetical protein
MTVKDGPNGRDVLSVRNCQVYISISAPRFVSGRIGILEIGVRIPLEPLPRFVRQAVAPTSGKYPRRCCSTNRSLKASLKLHPVAVVRGNVRIRKSGGFRNIWSAVRAHLAGIQETSSGVRFPETG